MKYVVHPINAPQYVTKIFFVGIKGVGVAPLALIAKGADFEIAGSDIGEEFITDVYLKKEEITLYSGFEINDILQFFGETPIDECLVITTGAHKGFDNPQVAWAHEHGIAVITQGQALALFMDGEILNREFKSIAVCGSHGKTTISSLLSSTLSLSDMDPTYSVGTGEVFPIGSPGHLGRGEYFVAEADEYASEPVYDRVPKLLYQNPNYVILNNIDFDHPDLFQDINSVVDTFLQFASNIKSGGILILNGDDVYLSQFKEKIVKDIRVITYGKESANDYIISKILSHGLTTQFTVHKRGKELGFFELNIPGVHNACNALSVIALLSELGMEYGKIRSALRQFKGTKRRLERVGMTPSGSTVIDDYGHHPLEITTTLASIRQAYPSKKIVCIFQPHTYSRTKALLPEFSRAFTAVDHLVLLPIFKSQRDTEKDLFPQDEYIDAFNTQKDATFFDNFDSVVKYCIEKFSSDEFVIVTIGAGDVYKIARQIVGSTK